MTTPTHRLHSTAVNAARHTRADIPVGEDHPIVLLAAGHEAMLSIVLDDVGLAVSLAETVAAIVALRGITIVLDAYYCAQPLDAHPGEGELEDRYASGDPQVLDALQVLTVLQGGTLYSTTLPYRPRGDRIVWDLPVEPPPSQVAGFAGRIPDGLRLAMLVEPKAPPDDLGQPVPEATRLELTAFALRMVGLTADVIDLP